MNPALANNDLKKVTFTGRNAQIVRDYQATLADPGRLQDDIATALSLIMQAARKEAAA